jgi:hypothetical protein
LGSGIVDSKFETAPLDYIFGKYLLPAVVTLGTLAMFGMVLYAYIASRESGALVALGALFLFHIGMYFLVGQQFLFLKKAKVSSEGIDFEGDFFSWQEITKISQVFVLRINVECLRNGVKRKFSIPMPFSPDNYRWPVPSAFLEDLKEMQNKREVTEL